jgi:predicted  nucleic acid-binding Zn-ribbon protein
MPQNIKCGSAFCTGGHKWIAKNGYPCLDIIKCGSREFKYQYEKDETLTSGYFELSPMLKQKGYDAWNPTPFNKKYIVVYNYLEGTQIFNVKHRKARTFEVQTHTICDGWINCWTVDGELQYFETREEAEANIAEFLDDVATEIHCGVRKEDEGYSEEDYRVVEVEK